MGFFGQSPPANRDVGLRSEESDVSIRMANLEAQCAEYKAGFDQLKSIIQRLEKVEVHCATTAQAHEESKSEVKDRLAKVEAHLHQSMQKTLKKFEAHDEKGEKDGADLAELGEASDGKENTGLLASMTSSVVARWDTAGIFDETDQYEISLPDSIYSDFVLTWARGKVLPIITSTLLCFACIVVQFLFICIVYELSAKHSDEREGLKYKEDFVTRFGVDGTLDGLRKSEYCNRSWTWESDAISTYKEYNQVHWIGELMDMGTPSGLVLGALSIALWAGACTAELRNILDFVSMLSLPYWDGGAPSYTRDAASGQGTLTSLAWRPRIAITIITICRIGIISCLGVVGCRFLIFTTDLMDFILNAVALSFVLEMDELCFKFLSPDKQQHFKTLSPPIMNGNTAKVFHWLSPLAEAASLASIGLITYFSMHELVGMSAVMIESLYDLCGVKAIDEKAIKYLSGKIKTTAMEEMANIVHRSIETLTPTETTTMLIDG